MASRSGVAHAELGEGVDDGVDHPGECGRGTRGFKEVAGVSHPGGAETGLLPQFVLVQASTPVKPGLLRL